MGKPDTKQVDREIREAIRKLEAVRNGELWPLTRDERRTVVTSLIGGSYRVLRGRSTARAEERLESVSGAAEMRLQGEITALQIERRRIITEHAQNKKKSSWW
ncbi:hypothetical protein [Streptomyces sp. 4F14]|uniref:hypothetical protein n=1 Tax=Streptomyces sp. 4F14 TaxID=3394380 RepID=UPI003A87C8A9